MTRKHMQACKFHNFKIEYAVGSTEAMNCEFNLQFEI